MSLPRWILVGLVSGVVSVFLFQQSAVRLLPMLGLHDDPVVRHPVRGELRPHLLLERLELLLQRGRVESRQALVDGRDLLVDRVRREQAHRRGHPWIRRDEHPRRAHLERDLRGTAIVA